MNAKGWIDRVNSPSDQLRELRVYEALCRIRERPGHELPSFADPKNLPRVAADLLVEGLDSEGLRLLAGLDLGGADLVNPWDAVDLLHETMEQLGIRPCDRDEEALFVLSGVGLPVLADLIDPGSATRWAYVMSLALDDPNEPPELYQLYVLDDAWHIGIQTYEQIVAEVKGVLGEVLAKFQNQYGDLPPRATQRLASLHGKWRALG